MEKPQTRQHKPRSEGFSLLVDILAIALAAWLLLTQVFLLTPCRSQDMYPTMAEGDVVLAYRLQRRYGTGDVVVYRWEGELCLGRIVAGEGHLVMMDDSGTLWVNGAVRDGDAFFPTYARDGVDYPFRVPEGCCFILGDHRTGATDSRDLGAIPLSCIEGKVITIVRGHDI